MLFLSVSSYSIAQKAWSVYEWKVKPQDVSTVFNICNDYLSQEGNVTDGTTVHNVLVFENGVCQQPTADYSVSGTTLTFGTAPANGVKIVIREL